MRPTIHFDGEPDTCARMRKLFSDTDRRRWKWRDRIERKFKLVRVSRSIEEWNRRYGSWGRRRA